MVNIINMKFPIDTTILNAIVDEAEKQGFTSDYEQEAIVKAAVVKDIFDHNPDVAEGFVETIKNSDVNVDVNLDNVIGTINTHIVKSAYEETISSILDYLKNNQWALGALLGGGTGLAFGGLRDGVGGALLGGGIGGLLPNMLKDLDLGWFSDDNKSDDNTTDDNKSDDNTTKPPPANSKDMPDYPGGANYPAKPK